MATVDTKYEDFNKFQNDFYTSAIRLEARPNIDFKKHGYALINNITKGFPNYADIIFNINGFGWKGSESPALIKAVQKNFLTKFNSGIPKFVFRKSIKQAPKKKVKETKHGLVFSEDVISEICSILIIDSKTYEYLKFSPKIQEVGKQVIGEIIVKEKLKKKRKT